MIYIYIFFVFNQTVLTPTMNRDGFQMDFSVIWLWQILANILCLVVPTISDNVSSASCVPLAGPTPNGKKKERHLPLNLRYCDGEGC